MENKALELLAPNLKGMPLKLDSFLDECRKAISHFAHYVFALDVIIRRLRKSNRILFYLSEADNFGVYRGVVEYCRQENIRSVLLQHGLDIPNYFYDDCFCDDALVWGEDRKTRYASRSRRKPKVTIVGNPLLDASDVSAQLEEPYWVYFPSALDPQKQMSSYRNVGKSVECFREIALMALEQSGTRLRVKLHPGDEVPSQLHKEELGAIKIIKGDGGSELVRNAFLVFAEDTSACIEAVAFGKRTVYINNSDRPDRIPLVAWGAGFSAGAPGELKATIRHVLSLSEEESSALRRHQRKLAEHYFGPLDGKSSERLFERIREIGRQCDGKD